MLFPAPQLLCRVLAQQTLGLLSLLLGPGGWRSGVGGEAQSGGRAELDHPRASSTLWRCRRAAEACVDSPRSWGCAATGGSPPPTHRAAQTVSEPHISPSWAPCLPKHGRLLCCTANVKNPPFLLTILWGDSLWYDSAWVHMFCCLWSHSPSTPKFGLFDVWAGFLGPELARVLPVTLADPYLRGDGSQ